jgi:hypothetical protein
MLRSTSKEAIRRNLQNHNKMKYLTYFLMIILELMSFEPSSSPISVYEEKYVNSLLMTPIVSEWLDFFLDSLMY